MFRVLLKRLLPFFFPVKILLVRSVHADYAAHFILLGLMTIAFSEEYGYGTFH
jgi:hypothetical protein